MLNILLLLQKQRQLFYLFASENIIGSLFKIMFGKYKYHYFFSVQNTKEIFFLHCEKLLFALTFTNTWQHWIALILRFVFSSYIKKSFYGIWYSNDYYDRFKLYLYLHFLSSNVLYPSWTFHSPKHEACADIAILILTELPTPGLCWFPALWEMTVLSVTWCLPLLFPRCFW